MILLATFVQVADILNARLSEGMEVREIVEKEGKKEKGEVQGMLHQSNSEFLRISFHDGHRLCNINTKYVNTMMQYWYNRTHL